MVGVEHDVHRRADGLTQRPDAVTVLDGVGLADLDFYTTPPRLLGCQCVGDPMVIGSFGWDRVVWGSDWPVCTLATPLGRWMDCTRKLVAEASYDESARLFSRNAARIYRLL